MTPPRPHPQLRDTLTLLSGEIGVWATSAAEIERDISDHGVTTFVLQEMDLLRQHLEQLQAFVGVLAGEVDQPTATAVAAARLTLSGLAARLQGEVAPPARARSDTECDLW